MASPLSAETDLLDDVGNLYLSEQHSKTETDEPSEKTTDNTQGGMQLISKNTKSLMWKYFGFTPVQDGRPTNYCNPKCKLCFKEVSAKFSNTSNLLKHLRLHIETNIAKLLVHKQQNPGLLNHRERINLRSQHFKHVSNNQGNIVLILKNIEDC